MTEAFSILLVNDDPSIADLLTQASQQVFPEARFTAVGGFPEAVAYFETLSGPRPSLVLLDLNLNSQQNGLDFLRLMRQHPQGRYLPIIILSASRDVQKMEESYRQGATAFTVKPFSYSEWKEYTRQLRDYWFGMASLPIIWFGDPRKRPRWPR